MTEIYKRRQEIHYETLPPFFCRMNTNQIWRFILMEKFFKLKDGEPTKTYLKMSRVGGAVISVASFVAMVVSFF